MKPKNNTVDLSNLKREHEDKRRTFQKRKNNCKLFCELKNYIKTIAMVHN
jgi:hypothetical protein